jgi:hypothetical protein
MPNTTTIFTASCTVIDLVFQEMYMYLAQKFLELLSLNKRIRSSRMIKVISSCTRSIFLYRHSNFSTGSVFGNSHRWFVLTKCSTYIMLVAILLQTEHTVDCCTIPAIVIKVPQNSSTKTTGWWRADIYKMQVISRTVSGEEYINK